jgi:2-keto-3-deoxy-galactonokinase
MKVLRGVGMAEYQLKVPTSIALCVALCGLSGTRHDWTVKSHEQYPACTNQVGVGTL